MNTASLISRVARRVNPSRIARSIQQKRKRSRADRLMGQYSLTSSKPLYKEVLVDGLWDNPNYWLRYALIRRAFGLSGARETGIVGLGSADVCRRTLAAFGVKKVVSVDDSRGDPQTLRREAMRYLSLAPSPEDALLWNLPNDFPAAFFYDALIKRQRTASLDLKDPKLVDFMVEGLGFLQMAKHLFETHSFDLVLISHVVSYRYGSLAWEALKRGIPVIMLYGSYGVPRFVRFNKASELTDMTDRPVRAEVDGLSPPRADLLATTGQAYLTKRLSGLTNDLSSHYAYKSRKQSVDRDAILQRFHWDKNLPIIGVYAANWFDYPHMCGMTSFRDFRDWLEVTLKAAETNRGVQWLFKAHPCDDWYKGVTLKDLMPPTACSHVQMVPLDWNGSDLIQSLDGVVTFHGTAGVEFAAAGKPVLLADRGWYHDIGFAKCPSSRQDYKDLLATDWWSSLNLKDAQRRAHVFSGWYFGHPEWQGSRYILEDDLEPQRLYDHLPRLLQDHAKILEQEVRMLQEWHSNGHRCYHTFKMSQAPSISS